MAIARETLDAMRRLANLMIQDEGPIDLETLRDAPFMDRAIPDGLRRMGEEGAALLISGDSYRAFRTALAYLEAEGELEHLTSKDIDASLWEFCCELFLDRDEYQKQGPRHQRVKAYLDNITKAHTDFEVVVLLENISVESPLTFDGVRFEHWTERQAKEWQAFDKDLTADFVDRPVAIAVVKAGHVDWAVSRAQRKIDEALDALRFGFRASIMIRVRDNELMMRQGDRQLVKAESLGRWQKWNVSNRPSPTPLNRTSIDRTLTYLRPLSTLLARDGLSSKVKDRFRLALHWLGAAVARRDHDEKVIDLCTAFEALFCDKSDKRKGELISLRAMLLQCAATGGFSDTFPLLRLYELRSSLVHGSEIGICGDAHYRFLVGDILRLLQMQAEFLNGHPEITTFAKFVKAVETPEFLAVALRWFEPLGDDAADLIAEVKRRLPPALT
jgi:hypothetical protein